MITFFNINIAQYIIKETINDELIEHIINGDKNDAERHYNLLLNNRPTDVRYNLKLLNNELVVIKEYDSISDNC